MKTFKNWKSYYEFAKEVIYGNRYFYSSESQDFLDTLLETSRYCIKTLKKDYKLWRARLGGETQNGTSKIVEPYKAERMKPSKEFASEGRANPKGIPYLYLATTKETAMAEVRPWKSMKITVSQFSIIEYFLHQ